MRVKVIYGILGAFMVQLAVIQGLGLSGTSFGDVSIVRGWKGGVLPTPLVMVAMCLFYLAFCKGKKDGR